ncbi:hypothetical protein KCP91_12055 [Microvirga sp. SRT01]|jgi:hypothetical protein|uniref:Uncharacterized protein n=1 Tax=Sphingomonas longa TaxID=2778730 RepID=A0ABS2D852_9SPHN|nr:MULTISPECIES: hypothetical protein [Alphaproteobacteria]MBM6577106.1 hypothetical protein [Sphingomonas sp. BT552]MBR7710150.1 hypothetical protein [Microvirga sp. SRT01]
MASFEVRNVAGRLQFSVDQPPLSLLQKITLTLNAGTPNRIGGGSGSTAISHYGTSVTIPAATQIMATYCTMTHKVNYRYGNTAYIAHAYNGNVALELFCFGFGVPTSNSGGFEMRDASNQVIFNANTRVLKPVAFVTYANPDGNNGNGSLLSSYTGPSGRKLAFVMQNEGSYLERNYDYNPQANSEAPQYIVQTEMFASAMNNFNNSINFDSFLMNRLKALPADSDESGPPQVNARGSGLVIDVTNY